MYLAFLPALAKASRAAVVKGQVPFPKMRASSDIVRYLLLGYESEKGCADCPIFLPAARFVVNPCSDLATQRCRGKSWYARCL